MKIKKFWILFSMIMILSIALSNSMVFATDSYSQVGTTSSNFYMGDTASLWNDANDGYNVAEIDPLNNPSLTPLIYDFDSDGTLEIVLLASGSIIIKQLTETQGSFDMRTIDSFSLTGQEDGEYYSNMILYDIDSDGIQEIIVHEQEAGELWIVAWNGTEIIDKGSFPFGLYNDPIDPLRDGDSQLGCGTEGCVIVWNNGNRWKSSGASAQAHIQAFDETGFLNSSYMYFNAYNGNPRCYPRISGIIYTENKYFFTDSVYPSGTYVNSFEIIDDEIINYDASLMATTLSGNTCGRGTTYNMLPSAFNFDSDKEGSDNEIMTVGMTGASSFRIWEFTHELVYVDTIPEASDSDGQIISPVIAMKAFTDSPSSMDACVLGYDNSEKRVELRCASRNTNCFKPGQDNLRFAFDLDADDYNITSGEIWANIIHTIDATQGSSTEEVLTPYGVFELENVCDVSGFSTCYLFGTCSMDRIWNTPVTREAVMIPIDVAGVEYDDILALSSSNLYFIDDGFTNQQAYLEYCTKIEPDIDAIWKLDNYTSQEGISGEINETVDSFGVIMGSDVKDSFYQTYALDTYFHETKEDEIGGRESLEVRYNFTDIPEGEYHNLVFHINYNFDSEDDEDIEFYAYNYDTSNWALMFIQPSEHSATYYSYNYTFNIPENYISGGIFQLKISDEVSVIDSGAGTDDKIKIDYLVLSINHTGEGGSSSHSNKVRVTVKVNDIEGNNVKSKIYLYYGESGQQETDWSTIVTQGTPVMFDSLYPNELTSGSILRIEYTDADNYNDTPVHLDKTFIVQTEGDLYMESQSCEGITEEEYEAGDDTGEGEGIEGEDCLLDVHCLSGYFCGADNECHSDATNENNAINIGVQEMSDWTGLSPGLIFIIVLALIIYGLFMERGANTHPGLLVGGSIAVIFFGIIIGAKIGLIGTGTIIVLSLLGLIIVGVVFAKMFLPGSGGGGD